MTPDDVSTPAVPLPPRWVRPLLFVAVLAMLFVAVVGLAVYIPPVFPAHVLRGDKLAALGYVLAPVLLLFTLFDARRGVERGFAAETGILPGLLLFGVLMFVGGSISRFAPHAPGLGLLLLAAFAIARADPPAPIGVRLVWAVLAVASGAWCIYIEPAMWSSLGTLILYMGWSAGRGAGGELPVPPARRITGMLLFVSLVAVPAASRFDVELLIMPLCVTAGLILLDWCSPLNCRAGAPPAA